MQAACSGRVLDRRTAPLSDRLSFATLAGMADGPVIDLVWWDDGTRRFRWLLTDA